MDTPVIEALLHRPGQSTSAINWCELDFVVTPHVAEFYNTISSLLFCVAGLSMYIHAQRLPLPIALLAAGPVCVALGLASAVYHATLQLWWQRADELTENWLLVLIFHGMRRTGAQGLLTHVAASGAGILLVSAILFTELHLVSMALANGARFMTLVLPGRGAVVDRVVQSRVRVGALAVVLAALCWLVDRVACSAVSGPFNPQLHAWWHALGALGLHETATMAAYAHMVLHEDSAVSARVVLAPALAGLVSVVVVTSTKSAQVGD